MIKEYTKKINKIPMISVRGAILAGFFGGVLFGVNFCAQFLVGILGQFGATVLFTGFTVPFFLVIASRLNKQWGTATIIWTFYSFLAIATLLMGTPGPHKLLVGFFGGLAYDIGFCGLRCKTYALYISLFLYVIVQDIGFYIVFLLGFMPEFSDRNVIYILGVVSVIFLFEGFIATFIANKFYVHRVKPLLR